MLAVSTTSVELGRPLTLVATAAPGLEPDLERSTTDTYALSLAGEAERVGVGRRALEVRLETRRRRRDERQRPAELHARGRDREHGLGRRGARQRAEQHGRRELNGAASAPAAGRNGS